MDIRRAVRSRFLRVSTWYATTARFFFVATLFLSIFLPALAAGALPPQVTVNITGSNAYTTYGLCGYGTCTPATVDGNFTISGSYSGNVYFSGQAAVDAHSVLYGSKMVNWTFNSSFEIPASGGHSPPMNYPSETNAYFSSTYCPAFSLGCLPGYGWSTVDWTVTICAYSDPGFTNLLGCGSVTSSGNIDTYVLAVAVPLFNDTMLGVSCQTVQSLCQGGSDSLYGYQIPVGNLYNFLMAIALVLLGVGALLAFMGRVAIGTGEKNNIIMDSVVGVAVILLFPLIYNFVGSIVDYVDQAVIAYPNDYQTYGNALQSVWNQFQGLDTSSWWNVIFDAVNTLAGWVISVILWIMLRLVGTVRLFIFAVVIAGMPLSMGLRLIPFTRKLSQYIEETLFGLLLASLLSAVILGVAAYLFAHWSDPTNIFATGGIEERWVAAAALFAALLLPTVFAPLTAFVFQTTSQAAIAAGGVAASTMTAAAAPMTGAGAGMVGMGGGVSGLTGMGSGLAKGAGSAAQGIEQAGMSGIQVLSHLGTAAFQGMKNAAVVGTTGTLGAIGMTGAAKVMGRTLPLTSHQDMARMVQQGEQGRQAAFANSIAPNEGDFGTLGIPTGIAANPEVQVAAQQRYGSLSRGDQEAVMKRMAAIRGVNPAQAASVAPLVNQQTWQNIQQKIQNDPSFAGSFYTMMNPALSSRLESAVGGHLQSLANTNAGTPTWNASEARAWADRLMSNPNRLVDHLAGHDPSYAVLRQDPTLSHRVITSQFLQQVKNDPQAPWNLKQNLNEIQQGTHSTYGSHE